MNIKKRIIFEHRQLLRQLISHEKSKLPDFKTENKLTKCAEKEILLYPIRATGLFLNPLKTSEK